MACRVVFVSRLRVCELREFRLEFVCVGVRISLSHLTHPLLRLVAQTTIGVDFALKRVQTEGTDINVQLWDIAGASSLPCLPLQPLCDRTHLTPTTTGQERFAGLSRIFYTHAVAAVIVFDLFDRCVRAQVVATAQHGHLC